MKQPFPFSDLAVSIRPVLGGSLPIETYRLLRLSGMQELFGDSTGPVLYRLGKLLIPYFQPRTESDLLALIKDLGIGIPEIHERTDDRIVVNLYECMTCAGLPVTRELICDLECGFIAGGIEVITGSKTRGTQTKSWTSGNNYCEFVIELF